jgi:hypothetical protein
LFSISFKSFHFKKHRLIATFLVKTELSFKTNGNCLNLSSLDQLAILLKLTHLYNCFFLKRLQFILLLA